MKPGIYRDMPMAQYLAIQAVSSGIAQTILTKSPLHAWGESPWNPQRRQDSAPEADIGTYAHATLLEGELSSLVIVDADDWRTKAAREARDAAYAAGDTPILARKVAEVQSMVETARAFIDASELAGIWNTGAPEQTLIWEHAGMLCKARPDWLTADKSIGLSYKTTPGSANPDAWIRTQLPGYDLGIVFYEMAISAAGKVERPQVITLVQEQKHPYACSLIALAPAWQALAQSKLARALSIWSDCVARGEWRAYPHQICHAEPKPWMFAEQEEREADDISEHGLEYDPAKLWEKKNGN